MIKVFTILSSEGTLDVNKGYLFLSSNRVGGAYQGANINIPYTQLTNNGTIIGNTTLKDEQQIYNYVSCLIPGFYPEISGPYSENKEYYEMPTGIICKSLGFGLGTSYIFSVSSVNKTGLQTSSYNWTDISYVLNNDNVNFRTLINFSNINETMNNSNITEIGPNPYLLGYNWQNTFSIQQINGTNQFPFMGWGGARIGNTPPVNSEFSRDSLYNYPASELTLAREYDSLGIIFAGQGTQYSSLYIVPDTSTLIEKNIKKKNTPIYKKRRKINTTNVLTYQQGRGSFDFLSNNISYQTLRSQVKDVFTYSSIPAEGVQPGRNNAFAGVALSDYWSSTLNLENVNKSSRTPKDTRTMSSNGYYGFTAHNAPLNFIPKDYTVNNASPWNTLFSYVGDTNTEPSKSKSDSVPIMNEGITTMVISGAYPLYRKCYSNCRIFNPFSEYSVNSTAKSLFSYTGNGSDQYYYTSEFWDANYKDPISSKIQQVNVKYPVTVDTNPPYKIKGGRIVLYEGQSIKAGSYAYISMNGVQNVTVPQFVTSSGKEIKLNKGERNVLISDIYSKYQGNQGSLIVIVSENDKVPMPPSCCQPIGIVMETITGFGSPLKEEDGTVITRFQTTQNESRQPCNDFSKVSQIQGREIIVKLLPMYADFAVSGITILGNGTFKQLNMYPTTLRDAYGLPNTVHLSDVNPLYVNYRTNYCKYTGINEENAYLKFDPTVSNETWASFEYGISTNPLIGTVNILTNQDSSLSYLTDFNRETFLCA